MHCSCTNIFRQNKGKVDSTAQIKKTSSLLAQNSPALVNCNDLDYVYFGVRKITVYDDLYVIINKMRSIAVLVALCLACIFQGLATTTSPIVLPQAASFRSGQTTLITGVSINNFYMPFSSALSSSNVRLALSLVDQHVEFLAGAKKLQYYLSDNFPSASDSTTAVFTAQFSTATVSTLRAKIRYVACPIEILSSNLQILTYAFGTGSINGNIMHTIPDSFNTTTGTWDYAIFIKSIVAQANNSGDPFHFIVGITVPTQWFVSTPYPGYIWQVRVNFFFWNFAISQISGKNLIFSYINVLSSASSFVNMNSYAGYMDNTNTICGLKTMQFYSNALDSILSISGRRVYFQSTMTPSGSGWCFIYCFVLVSKLCPTSFPYYDASSSMCSSVCDGTYNSNYECTYLCPLGCSACPSSTSCTTCSSGYFKRADSLCYPFCLPETYQNSGTLTCDSCPSNCSVCSSSSSCITCSSGYYKRADSTCYSFCLPATFANNATFTCDKCSIGCTNCSSLLICQSCLSSYWLKSYGSGLSVPIYCEQCLLGWGVLGGCTKTYGCLEVVYKQSDALYGECIKCSSSFSLISSGCECREGKKLVGQYCISIPGCVTTALIAGSVVCQFCDILGHFLFDHQTNTCYCNTYYSILNNSCQEICGDGVVIMAQCDDGNTENGDGCSSNCQVQPKYRCSTNSSLSPSVCQFISSNLTVSLGSIERGGEDNKAIFVFIFNPNLYNLKYIQINDFFSLSCDAVLGPILWKYQDGKVTATVNFESDLEGKEALVNFTFNQKYVSHQPITLNFTMNSKNIQLVHYQSETIQQTQTFKNIFLGISCGALFLLLVGTWIHKMVGVELIHALQIVYYLHFTFKDYSLPLSSLQSLSFISFNDLHWQTELQNFQSHSSYQKVQFSVDRTELTLFFLVIPTLLSILGLIVYLLTLKYAQIQTTKSVLKVIRRIYNGAIFPVTLGFLILYFLVKITLEMKAMSSSEFSSQLISFCSLLIFSLTSAVLSYELKNHFVSSGNEEDKRAYWFGLAKQYYIPSYCLYSVVMVILISAQIEMGFSLSPILIISMSGLMILFLIKFRIYFKIIDIVSTISNYFFQIGFIVTLQLRNKEIIPSDKNTDLIILLGMAAFIMISILLSVVRILCTCSYNEREGGSLKEEQKTPQKKQEKMKRINNQQISMKEMLMKDLQRYISSKQVLPRSIVDQNVSINQKIPIDPQLQKIMDTVRKTFKRKAKIPSKMVMEERENKE